MDKGKSIGTNRRGFINRLTGISVLAAVSPTFATASLTGVPKALGGFTGPYLQNLTPHGVTIMVIDHEDSETWVEIEGDEKRVIRNKADGLYEIGTGAKRFAVTGLKPGTAYRYRIVRRVVTVFKTSFMEFADIATTPMYTFTTPRENENTVSCLVLNDIHNRPESYAKLIGLSKDPYDFVVLNGDLLGEVFHERQLAEEFLDPVVSAFAKEKPFIFVRGNHETRGRFSARVKDYFAYPDNRYYFNFRQGPVNFTVLDTGEDKRDDHRYYAGLVDFDSVREEQAAWFEQVVRSRAYRRSPFKVVFMHIPPFHSGGEHGTMHCRKLFSPLFDKYKVDVVISGHVHRYGIHRANEAHAYPIVIGGGPLENERSLITLNASSRQLNVTLIREDGTVVGQVNVEK